MRPDQENTVLLVIFGLFISVFGVSIYRAETMASDVSSLAAVSQEDAAPVANEIQDEIEAAEASDANRVAVNKIAVLELQEKSASQEGIIANTDTEGVATVGPDASSTVPETDATLTPDYQTASETPTIATDDTVDTAMVESTSPASSASTETLAEEVDTLEPATTIALVDDSITADEEMIANQQVTVEAPTSAEQEAEVEESAVEESVVEESVAEKPLTDVAADEMSDAVESEAAELDGSDAEDPHLLELDGEVAKRTDATSEITETDEITVKTETAEVAEISEASDADLVADESASESEVGGSINTTQSIVTSPTASNLSLSDGVSGGVSDAESTEPQTADEKRVAQRPWLGVRMQRPKPRIILVHPDSGAADTEISIGDLIVAVGKTEVASTDDVVAALGKLSASDSVAITVLRGDERLTFTTDLGKARPLKK